MKTKILKFSLSMIFFYLLVSFATAEIDFRLWKIEVRAMYALFAPIMSILTISDL